MTRCATSFRDGLYACDRCGKTFSIPDVQDYSSYFLTWHSCAACTRCRPGSQQSGFLSLYWPCLSAFLRPVERCQLNRVTGTAPPASCKGQGVGTSGCGGLVPVLV